MAILVRMLHRSTTQQQQFIQNYDKNKIEKNQHGPITRWPGDYYHGEKLYFVSKSKFTQIATYRESTVQSEDRKKKHTVKNRFQSGKQ